MTAAVGAGWGKDPCMKTFNCAQISRDRIRVNRPCATLIIERIIRCLVTRGQKQEKKSGPGKW
ncbi:MAG: hypothetical protein IPJ06_17670 [Saprospiraceae bacterium]|nr:hypothetical protein [Saprospiraceae bacterium]